jgi:hypothetical protein
VSAYADLGYDRGPNQVELETVKPLTLPVARSRFLIFSADVAEVNCAAAGNQPALFAFFLLTQGDEVTLGSAPTDVCAKGHDLGDGVRGGRIASDGSVLFAGSELGVRLRNAQPSGFGKRPRLRQPRRLRRDPAASHAVRRGLVARGDVTALTYTVTNTTELAPKSGWSFVETLPAALRVGGPDVSSTTCPGGVVTAAPGERRRNARRGCAQRRRHADDEGAARARYAATVTVTP